jgi:hypothetical protein
MALLMVPSQQYPIFLMELSKPMKNPSVQDEIPTRDLLNMKQGAN